MDNPTQREIDAVAHFAEAVRELRTSPFFIEEYHNLKLSFRAGDPPEKIEGGFPDPNVVRAMLVPFRRLWQEREPCFHAKVVKILKRYDPNGRGFIDSFVFSDSAAHVRRLPFYAGIALLPSEAIDLWLNTKEFHTGETAKKGRYTRQDFERHEKQLGRVLFEYYFLSSIHEVTICFFNLGRCCEAQLREWESKGIRPSFALSVVNPAAIQSQEIRRMTPGFTPPTDSPAHRIWQLKRRRQYDAINNLIEGLPISDESLARHIRAATQFDEVLADLRIPCEKIQDVNSLDLEQESRCFGVADSPETVWKTRKMRRGMVAMYKNGSVFHTDDALGILRDQYLEFRGAFLREPFM